MSFIHTLQSKYKEANSVEKLIYINVAIFILSIFFSVLPGLYKGQTNWLVNWFSLNSSTEVFSIKTMGNCFLRIFTRRFFAFNIKPHCFVFYRESFYSILYTKTIPDFLFSRNYFWRTIIHS